MPSSARPAASRSLEVSTPACTRVGPGRCASTRGSAPPRSPTSATAICSSTGQTGLSVAFDLPTQMGYDSDHPVAAGEVGQGRRRHRLDRRHARCSSTDPARPGHDLDDHQRAGRGPAAALPARRRGAGRRRQRSSAGPSRTMCSRSTSHGAPTSTRRARPCGSSPTSSRTARPRLPRWNTISISGYHMAEAGATPAQEVAFTLANGVEYVRAAIAGGLEVDDFAPRLAFFFVSRTTLLEEVAKFRAARRLWARIMRDEFGAKKPRVADAALPHADGRRPAHRAAARDQPGARGRPSSGGSARRHPVACTPTATTRRSPFLRRRQPGSRFVRSKCSPTRPT